MNATSRPIQIPREALNTASRCQLSSMKPGLWTTVRVRGESHTAGHGRQHDQQYRQKIPVSSQTSQRPSGRFLAVRDEPVSWCRATADRVSLSSNPAYLVAAEIVALESNDRARGVRLGVRQVATWSSARAISVCRALSAKAIPVILEIQTRFSIICALVALLCAPNSRGDMQTSSKETETVQTATSPQTRACGKPEQRR